MNKATNDRVVMETFEVVTELPSRKMIEKGHDNNWCDRYGRHFVHEEATRNTGQKGVDTNVISKSIIVGRRFCALYYCACTLQRATKALF